jgi:beta-lactamase superfamily II metal-dependent hydrolase
MIVEVCKNSNILEAISVIRMIMLIVAIVVPICLMFSVMFKFIKAAWSADSYALNNAKNGAVANIKAAALIFLIPGLIGMLMGFLPDSIGYKECIDNSTPEGIAKSQLERLEKLVTKAEETLDKNNYNTAYMYAKKLTGDEVEPYKERLDVVREKIFIKNSSCIISHDAGTTKITIVSIIEAPVKKDVYINDERVMTTESNSQVFDEYYSNIKIKYHDGAEILCTTGSAGGDSGILEIYYLGLGRFDGYLIIGNDTTLFIDGGYPTQAKKAIDFIKKLGITRIDGLIGSHLHDNHIAAHKEFIRQMEIGEVYYGDDPRTCIDRKSCVPSASNPTELVKLIDDNNITMTILKPGLDIKIGNLTFDILEPDKIVTGGGYPENNNSLNMILKFGEHKFYFSGDHVRYEDILKKYDKNILDVDIFKYPHHGQAYVSTEFNKALTPKYVIVPHITVSSGITNQYKAMGAEVFVLGTTGYVLAKSDGYELSVVRYNYDN